MVPVVTLVSLLDRCAPAVGRRTMSAIVEVESGGHVFAIHDNTLGRSFTAVDTNEAVAWSDQLLRLHHSVDLGIAQINDSNLSRLGLSVREAFDPCLNLHAGAAILAYDYHTAMVQFGPGQYALRRAIGAYNTGSIFGGQDYVARILAAAGLVPEREFEVPNLEPLDPSGAVAGGAAPAVFVRGSARAAPPPIRRRSAVLAARHVRPHAKSSAASPILIQAMQSSIDESPRSAATPTTSVGFAPAPATPNPNAPFVLTVSDAAPAPFATPAGPPPLPKFSPPPVALVPILNQRIPRR